MNLTQNVLYTALGLLVAGCGGTGSDASDQPPAVAETGKPASKVTAASAAPTSAVIAPAPALALKDWLDSLAARHRLSVTVDAAIARQPLVTALPVQLSGDELALTLAAFDLVLGYARTGSELPRLVSLAVYPRGTLAARRAPRANELQTALPVAAEAPEADPQQALQRIQLDLASADADVRRAALVKSFDLETPLPAPMLVAALQGDAAAEMRLFALMALARHPAIKPTELRGLVQTARHDADAAVRSHADGLEAVLDATERAAE